MISRAKFSCGFALVFVRLSSQTSIAVSFAMLVKYRGSSERVLAQHLDLTAYFARISTPSREIARAFGRANVRRSVVGGREVVVPEQRHLLLKRTIAVHHAEEPPLPCIDMFDWGARTDRGSSC